MKYLGLGDTRSATYSKIVPEGNSPFYYTCKFAMDLRLFKHFKNTFKKCCSKDALHLVKMQLSDFVEGWDWGR